MVGLGLELRIGLVLASWLGLEIQVGVLLLWNLGKPSKNPAYRILQTEYSGCLDVSAHA